MKNERYVIGRWYVTLTMIGTWKVEVEVQALMWSLKLELQALIWSLKLWINEENAKVEVQALIWSLKLEAKAWKIDHSIWTPGVLLGSGIHIYCKTWSCAILGSGIRNFRALLWWWQGKLVSAGSIDPGFDQIFFSIKWNHDIWHNQSSILPTRDWPWSIDQSFHKFWLTEWSYFRANSGIRC